MREERKAAAGAAGNMKLYLTVAALLAAVLLGGCDIFGDEDKQNAVDVTGIWTGSSNERGTLELGISGGPADGNWTLSIASVAGEYHDTFSGSWASSGSAFKLMMYGGEFGTVSLSGDKLLLVVLMEKGPQGSYTLTKNREGEPGSSGIVQLRIKNESFTAITDVIWQGINFTNPYAPDTALESGNNVTKNVAAGSGYIFFKRKNNPVSARTQQVVTIEKGHSKEFAFTENTLVVQVSNPGNTGTLGSLTQTTPAGLVTSWSGDWIKNAANDNEYSSNTITYGNTTWQTLSITSTYGCSVRILLTASCLNGYNGTNYGYASKLDGAKSISDYQLMVTGNNGTSYIYAVPAGTHHIYFGYARNYSSSAGKENITVEVAAIE